MRALVIGGTKGFGAEVSKKMLDNGFGVVTVGRTKPEFEVEENYICDVGEGGKWIETINSILERDERFDLIFLLLVLLELKDQKI